MPRTHRAPRQRMAPCRVSDENSYPSLVSTRVTPPYAQASLYLMMMRKGMGSSSFTTSHALREPFAVT